MYAVFIILNDLDKYDDIMKIFHDEGCGATSLDSEGLGHVLLDHNIEVPLFAGLRKFLEGDKPYNKTIISIMKNEEKKRKIVDTISKNYLDENGSGIMFVMPVLECYGMRNESYIH